MVNRGQLKGCSCQGAVVRVQKISMFWGILEMSAKVVYTFYRRLGCAGANVG